MRLRTLLNRIGTYWRRHGTLATVQFLASRIVRHQRHVVFLLEAYNLGTPRPLMFHGWRENG